MSHKINQKTPVLEFFFSEVAKKRPTTLLNRKNSVVDVRLSSK